MAPTVILGGSSKASYLLVIFGTGDLGFKGFLYLFNSPNKGVIPKGYILSKNLGTWRITNWVGAGGV